MSPGSAAPQWFADWLHGVRRGLIVGGEHPNQPGVVPAPAVAYDGLTGTEGAESTIEASFSGSSLTRSAGSFIDDGWRIGMSVVVDGSALNDGTHIAVAAVTDLTLSFTGSVAFTTEIDTAGVELTGTVVDGFALYFGPTHLHAWTDANVCVIVPSIGTPGDGLQARRTATPRKALGAVEFAVDVHIWGAEPAVEVDMRDGFWDIERYRYPGEIAQNVLRVMFWLAKGFHAVTAVDGWSNETEQMRHGELLKFTFSASFPVYDYADTMLPSGLILTGSGQPTIRAPGAP